MRYKPKKYNVEKLKTFVARSKKSQEEVKRIFVDQKGLLDKYPHQMMKGMAYFEFFYMQQLKDHEKDLERFEGFIEPEVRLMLEVVEYFKSNPKLGISDLLSNIDPDSASFIGSLISTSPIIEEKNSLAYLQDCLSLLKKSPTLSFTV